MKPTTHLASGWLYKAVSFDFERGFWGVEWDATRWLIGLRIDPSRDFGRYRFVAISIGPVSIGLALRRGGEHG